MTDVEPVDDPRGIVAAGYDAIAERYYAWSDARPSPTRMRWLAKALERIPPGTDVLDLGCGTGVPMTRALAVGRRVTGVDISARQIELARAAVPEATFVQADMTALDLAPASLDAVVAFYSLTHVPRADLPQLLAVRKHGRSGDVVADDAHLGGIELGAHLCQCSVDDRGNVDRREGVFFLFGVLQEMRDAPLDPVELPERHLGILNVLH